jgi:hypothetical protein
MAKKRALLLNEKKRQGRLPKYRNVFFHRQSKRWRAVVKKKNDGTRQVKHFQSLKAALAAASEGLGQPVKERQNRTLQKIASLYEGVFVALFWAPIGRLQPIG